jgi:Pyruvate/2-oxoacid:ferredoxin oxidoreductase gamma subunit
VLSRHLPFSVEAWNAAIGRNLPEKLHEANLRAFSMGRAIEQR